MCTLISFLNSKYIPCQLICCPGNDSSLLTICNLLLPQLLCQLLSWCSLRFVQIWKPSINCVFFSGTAATACNTAADTHACATAIRTNMEPYFSDTVISKCWLFSLRWSIVLSGWKIPRLQSPVWIGGYKSSGTWIWRGRVTGEINYSWWDVAQPSYDDGVQENCLLFAHFHDYAFHDYICSKSLYFMCEK